MITTLAIKGEGIDIKNLIQHDTDQELDFIFKPEHDNALDNSKTKIEIIAYSFNHDENEFNIEDCYLEKNLTLKHQIIRLLNDEFYNNLVNLIETHSV